MTGPQLLVLQEVYKERGITAKRIAENVNLSQGTITTILDKLESRDLVNRIRSETDRRRVSLFLTEKGSLLLEKAPKPMQEEFIERFKNLDEWEQNLLLSSFSRVAQMMDASKIDAAPLLEIGTIVDPVKKVDIDKKSDKPT